MKNLQALSIWLIATLFVVYEFCLVTAAGVFSDPIKNSLHTSDIGVSVAGGAFIIGFACLQIPAGYLFDRFNAKYIMSAGLLLLTLGSLLISASNSLFFYTVANIIQGAGASFAFIAAAVLTAQWFKQSEFPIMFGLTQTLACILAAVIHYYFVIALTSSITWNQLYLRLAVFGVILFIASLAIVKSPAAHSTKKSLSLNESLKRVLTNKQMMLCTFAGAASFGVLLAYAGFWYKEVQNHMTLSSTELILISGIIFVGLGIGTPIFGWYSNIMRSRKMVLHSTLCLGTMLLLASIYLPAYSNNTLFITEVAAFLTGFFLSGTMLFYTVISELATDATRGVAISVLNTAVFLFNTAMLFIPYCFVADGSKEFYTYLWTLPLFLVLSLYLLFFIRETYQDS